MNENDLVYQVKEKDEKLLIKEILKRRMNFSSRLLRKLKKSGGVYNNNEAVYLNTNVRKGDMLRIVFPEETSYFEPEEIPISSVYEDQDILIINKEPGIVVHPTNGCKDGTVANGIVNYMLKRNEQYKIRFVNRLDRDTSGLLIIGKNSYIQEEISKQMKEGRVVKKYIAIVEGYLNKEEGIIDEPIKKNPGEAARVVSKDGRISVTEFKVIKRIDERYTVLEIILKTGRTHQIRVHMAHLGHPVVGDSLYGTGTHIIDRQALHAYYLSFSHPRNGKIIEVSAELPHDMERLGQQIKKNGKAYKDLPER